MTERLARGLAIGVLALGIALRVIQLGADPYYYEWNGYITDEGRWIAHARALVLFGEIHSVGSLLHLILAPLYQAASVGVFMLLDVSLWSSRLISVVSGSALLVAFWAAYRRVASPEALLLVLAMLAVEMDMVALSRLAVPEMAAMLLSLAAFLALMARRASRLRLAVAGLLTAAAVSMKATVLPLTAIFALIVLLRRDSERTTSRAAAVASFAAGLLVPAILAGVALVAIGVGRTPSSVATLRAIGRFVALTDPYGLVAFPFDDALAAVLGVWALAAWLGLLGALAEDGAPDEPGAAHLCGAALWAALFAGIMLALAYFPSRYKLHILVPMGVVAAVGITRLHRLGMRALGAGLAARGALGRAGAALLLALPSAVVLGAAVLAVGARLGVDPQRMRVRYAVLIAAVALLSAVAWVCIRRARGIHAFVWFPVCWMAAWLVAERLSRIAPPFWPRPHEEGAALRWLLLVLAAAGAVVAARAARHGRAAGSAALLGAALLYGVVGLARLAPGYLEPHHTMRDASGDLGALLAGRPGRIGAVGGEALFSDNRLPYRSLMGGVWPASPPDVLVLAGLLHDPTGRLDREYRLVRQYAIYVSPEFVLGEASWKPFQGQFLRTNVRVYRRAGEGG